MKRFILQIVLLFFLVSLCLSGYLLVTHFLRLPFRSSNDTLHTKNSPLNLDFFIPSGTHIDDKMTIGDVISMRFKKESSFFGRLFTALADLIPPPYRSVANLFLFIFWSILYLTFLRIFTFAGYGRAFRTSLFLGGCTYFFMPDFSIGSLDDTLFLLIPCLIILVRTIIAGRKKKKLKQLKQKIA